MDQTKQSASPAEIAAAVVSQLDALNGGDSENLHVEADDILCDAFRRLGYPEIAEAFDRCERRVGFWYA